MARQGAWRRISQAFKAEGERTSAPCWLCGQPIDYNDPTGRYGHAADHVLPVSDYPEHELDWANLRHAHIWCNSSRGNNTPTVKVNKTLNF